jgi:DNA-binding Lrp family transcriptional regulator
MPEQDQQTRGRRRDVLRLLRDAGGPISIAEIADRLGIHANTARFHLESLVRNGQVERSIADPDSPGRPPQLFLAARGMDPGPGIFGCSPRCSPPASRLILMRTGAMTSWGSSVTVDRLEPFAEPDLRLAHLSAATAS